MLGYTHRPNTLTVVAVPVVVPVHVVGIEVEVVGVVRVARVERARPVVAVGAGVVERAFVAIASRRQEQRRAAVVNWFRLSERMFTRHPQGDGRQALEKYIIFLNCNKAAKARPPVNLPSFDFL